MLQKGSQVTNLICISLFIKSPGDFAESPIGR